MIFILPVFVFAEYTFLEDLPGYIEPAAGKSQLTAYLTALFNFAIAVAAVLAVIMIVIGGLQYIGAAGNTSVIEDAKDRIYWAVVGLILALGSWMILFTINPKLLELKLENIKTQTIKAPTEEEKEKEFQIDMFSAKTCEELGPYKKCEPNLPDCKQISEKLFCRYEPQTAGDKLEGINCSEEMEKVCKNTNLKCAKFLKDNKYIIENCVSESKNEPESKPVKKKTDKTCSIQKKTDCDKLIMKCVVYEINGTFKEDCEE